MTHRSWAITGLVLLLLASPAFSQTTGSTTATPSDTSGASTSATSTSGTPTSGTSATATSSTGVGATIKQELRSGFAQLLVTAIHGMFQDLRTSLGLPAPADPTTDPLAILESAIVDFVNTFSTQSATSD